jgi:peptide/nickel transport system permease protein
VTALDLASSTPAAPARAGSRLAILRTPLGATAAVLVLLLAALAVLAPLLWVEQATAIDADALSEGPTREHLLGTDDLGRDILYRVLVATRLSLGLALLATLIGVTIGTLLGTAPTVLPRRIGRLVGAGVNVAVAFPGLLLALFFAVIFGVGTTGAVLAIGCAMAPSFARLTQTLAASVAGRDFVAAARVAGVGRFRLLVRHVLPNIAEPLVINATIAAGAALLAFAGLSFLGIGVQPPSYDWGRLLNEGLVRIYLNPAAALGPAVAVVLAGLAFNLVGESAAGALGGRSRRSRSGAPAAPVVPTTPSGDEADGPLLVVEDLRVSFPTETGWISPVRGVTFTIERGETVGVVGESGSGKSLTARARARRREEPGVVTAHRLTFAGTPLLATPEKRLRRLLGTSMTMVFQDPMTSFNPARSIGRQLAEVSEQHHGLGRRAALARAVDRLRAVRVTDPERRARQYPHEFSGGMRQRAMIGMGLMGDPRLVVADEPTTALDVTVQRQVLELLDRVRADEQAAVLLISHDLAVIGQVSDRILVMYAGRVVEELPASYPLRPRHRYSRALLDSAPDLHTDVEEPMAVIAGRPPEPGQVPPGCAFAPRCPVATDRCREEEPQPVTVAPRQRVACWHPVPLETAEAGP